MELKVNEGGKSKQTLLLIEEGVTLDSWVLERLSQDTLIEVRAKRDEDLMRVTEKVNELNPRQLSVIGVRGLAGLALNLSQKLPVRRLLLLEPNLDEFGKENVIKNRILNAIDHFIPFGLPMIRYVDERVPSWNHHRIRCPILNVGKQNLGERFPNLSQEAVLTPELLERFFELSFKCPAK